MADTLESFYGPEQAATILQPLPDDYQCYRANRGYFARDCKTEPLEAVNQVGPKGLCGVRWHHGPLHFEKYVMDEEPQMIDGPGRLVLWQRLQRNDSVKGWWRGTRGMASRMTGFARVAPGEGEAGTAAQVAGWTEHGRRHASRWQKLLASGEREVVPLTVDEYLDVYRRGDQDGFIKTFLPPVLRKKSAAHGDLMKYWGSRRAGGPIDAGICTLDVPEVSTLLHIGGFIQDSAKKESAAVGLISHSFDGCRQRGYKYLDFGFFWQPGDPSDWRGFSRFKLQFRPQFILYQPPLCRFAGKRRAGGPST